MSKLNHLKDLLNIRVHFNKNARNISDTRASQIIHGLFDQGTVLPFNPFSLNPNTILHLINEIIINKRSSVIEFGSGLSTVVLAKYVQLNQLPISILSVDDDQDWINLIKDQLRQHKCDSVVSFVYAPIKPYSSENHMGSWYDSEKITQALQDNRLDMVVVDGPGANTSRLARFPALEVIEKNLAQNFFVLLDDIRRSDEKIILNKWASTLGKNKSLKVSWNKKDVYGTLVCGDGFSSGPLSY
ncbi:MAG: hypothetical protein HKN48_01870 [Flavobacteriaceae bacterium]|nr:hypothetical protein [Flavobacteriaceae bacterium]